METQTGKFVLQKRDIIYIGNGIKTRLPIR